MKFTIEDIAQKYNIPRATAYNLVRGLEAIGAVTSLGRQKNPGQAGRARTTYTVTNSFSSIVEDLLNSFQEEAPSPMITASMTAGAAG